MKLQANPRMRDFFVHVCDEDCQAGFKGILKTPMCIN